MNCEQVRNLLIDFVYDELDPALRRPVADHLRSCDECSARLADLQAARKSLEILREDEPEALAFDPGPISEKGRAHRASRDRRPTRICRILVASAAVAASILTVVTVWMLHEETTPPALASGPVEIRRVGVSLTILSRPEGWGQIARFQAQRVVPKMQQTRGGYGRFGGWRGMALVRDRRLIRNLPPGRTQVRFTGVPSGILPDTVRLRSLDDPEGLTILEQNYQYDLASASAVLERYIDRSVAVTFKDGKIAAGELLSFDEKSLVIRPAGEGPRTIARDRARDIAFQKLPEGLLTRPTLVWELLNSGPARQQFEVAYLTHGIRWRVDYILKLHPAEEVIGGERPEITDTADLVGYATVTNNSGVTFEDAELKLLAGDVNLIGPPMEAMGVPILGKIPILIRGFQFQVKSFFEYHLYTLGRATTILNRETK